MKQESCVKNVGAQVLDKRQGNKNGKKICKKESSVKENRERLQDSEKMSVIFEFSTKMDNEEELQEVKNILSNLLKDYIKAVS